MNSSDLHEDAPVASDHRELNRRLDLYSMSEAIGPGLILWHPNGAMVRHLAERFSQDAHLLNGYEFVYTPHVGKAQLWETSGHLANYGDKMFQPMSVEDDPYYVKPMNCPFHVAIYKSRPRSYRELPKRFAEFGTVYRYELSGVLHGLTRARGFTVDDSHIFCRPDQLQDEIAALLGLVRTWYATFDLKPSFKLSTRPEKSLGTQEQWDQAEAALYQALAINALDYKLNPGDGAFYGPKIDIDVEDALGRPWQIATIQVDLTMLPERFQLEYIDADGQPKRPVAIHRAIFGSYERFIGILTEHFAGAFPTWLAPVQARVIPISEKHSAYARSVHERLRAARLRAELDDRNEKLGYRIREAQLRKVPYVLVVGEREAQAGTVSLRHRGGDDLGAQPLDRVVADLSREIAARSLALTVGRS